MSRKVFVTGVGMTSFTKPGAAAEAVFSLCAPQSNYISGQVVVCGGGISI